MQTAYKFVCEQSSCLMKTNRNRAFLQAKTTDEKHNAVKVMLTFSAPSSEKMTLVPSQRYCAGVLGMPQSTLATREKALIEKRRQVSASEKGIFWALAKCKKGYSKIDDAIRLLLIMAFNDHPHIILSTNARDTLQVKNADGKKVAVPKLLMQVGLGTIFSDIIKDNPTIKNKVGERAFRYIISGLGSFCCFTNSYEQMCGCTECVGLLTLHCLLLAKRGVMHRQFAVDAQHCTHTAQAARKASRWAAVAWHPKPLLAITEGTCQRWSLHAVPHWECQTLQCGNCKEYLVPKEEAREDGAAEDISFHVYEYKVSLHKDGKERRQLELVQKCTTIGKFHCLYYWPALGRGRYHSTSYMLAARCWRERRTIMHSSVSSQQNYGERMPLSFNEEIQSGYYQNTSVSVKGALIEWVNAAGEMRTRYFGHWSDDSKQDAAATTHSMCCELCVDGFAMQLVEGLMVGSIVWKGTDGAAMLYHCGKSIYGQGKLLAELHITINAQVEAPGHGKWWLDGKMGSDKHYCQQCMCCILTPEMAQGGRQMLSAKWIEHNGINIAVSPADECVRLLSDPRRLNGIKSKGMRAKREGRVLVVQNNYMNYTMENVPPLLDYKVVLPNGQFNGICAHYNIRTDPDLGMDWAAVHRVACGCGPCKDQLQRPWVLGGSITAQPRYAVNKDCELWPSYESANNWKIVALMPKTKADKKMVHESLRCILIALVACMSLMMREGHIGAVGTTDEKAMGYYLVKWLSKPYTLQEDTEGMSGMIPVRSMVVDGLYFNRVQQAPLWYTPSGDTTVVKIKYVLQTGLQLQPISTTNALPNACARVEAMWKKAIKVLTLDYEAIMEEATKHDRLEYEVDNVHKSNEDSEESKESDSESE